MSRWMQRALSLISDIFREYRTNPHRTRIRQIEKKCAGSTNIHNNQNQLNAETQII